MPSHQQISRGFVEIRSYYNMSLSAYTNSGCYNSQCIDKTVIYQNTLKTNSQQQE